MVFKSKYGNLLSRFSNEILLDPCGRSDQGYPGDFEPGFCAGGPPGMVVTPIFEMNPI